MRKNSRQSRGRTGKDRRYRKSENTLSGIVLGLMITIFILTASVVIILNSKWLYYIDISLLNIGKESGMTTAAMKENYRILIDYNQFWHQGPLQFSGLVMSDTARIHFEEVKRIFTVVQYLFMISGAGTIVGLFLKRKSRRKAYWLQAAVSTAGIPIVLGILAALDWDRFFVTFHTIFFRNDYWLFDPVTDPVIMMLPDTFFLHCAVGILLLIFLGSFFCWRRYRRA